MTLPAGIRQVSDFVWELPKTTKHGVPMHVPARIYGSRAIIEDMDTTVIEQITNVATLPGIIHHALCMPDGHISVHSHRKTIRGMDSRSGALPQWISNTASSRRAGSDSIL